MKSFGAILLVITMFVGALGLSGCTNMNRTQQGSLSGAAVGALAGAGISALAGGDGSFGALVGGSLGALAGGIYGHNQDRHHHPHPSYRY